MKRREFIKNTGLLTAASAAAPFMNFAANPSGLGRMIVLGFDGMDPGIVNRLMAKGELPNMQKLAQQGTFTMMRTSIPPQSPVAWGSFITGADPGVHGIYDFLTRTPETYMPKFSGADTMPAEWVVKLGKYKIPLKSSEILLRREGKAFWDYLEDRDIEATIFKIPSNYPPSESKQRTLAGMGTPGLRDGYGFYTMYTSDEEESMKDISPNYMYYAYIDDNNVMKGEIEGPVNDLVVDEENPRPIVPFKVYVDYKHKTARIDIDGKEILISEGEYSDWVEIDFPLIKGVTSITGMVKFFLLELGEKFRMYISPIHISPLHPAAQISTPESYSKELAEKNGLFHTINLPADTHALSKGSFSMENFIVQAMSVFDESRKLFHYELERYLSRKGGFLFFYFSSLDQGQHMFWALKDKDHPFFHPDEGKKFAFMTDELYRKHDRVLGEMLQKIPPGIKIVVMSDHGFAPFHKELNLNTWLFNEGYLKLDVDDLDEEVSLLEYAHWGETKAYAIGLNGLYLNLKGREAEGIVTPGEKRRLLDELAAKLEQIKDPDTGAQVVTKAFIAEDHFSKDFLDRAPDIIVGCNKGYRVSGSSALGGMNPRIVTPNMDWWSGDHCMNPMHVPATFISNFKINTQVPDITDMAPTILKAFGIENPSAMTGKSLI